MKKITNYTVLILFALAIAGTWQACSGDEDQTVANPQVKTFTPEAGGPVGTYVVISGNFFSPKADENVVEFNGVKATVISATTSTITTTVPAGASSGSISVSVKGHEGATPSSFAVTAGTPAPVILGFDPKTGFGSEGTDVTITGLNFGTTPIANVVKFNGPKVGDNATTVTATVTEATATSLKVKVPVGARTGKITVTSNAIAQGAGSSDTDFSVPGPSVASFTPTYSIEGSTVTITGANFSETAGKNVVTFNGVVADAPVNVSKTSLTVTVPSGASTGSLKVTVDGQTGDAGEFNLPHSITSFTPLLGPVGTDVVITGVNFSSKPENNVVKFNGKEVADKPTDVTHTSLKVKVPAGATTGKITVTINGFTAESLVNFTVN
jgi:hypothetical protein